MHALSVREDEPRDIFDGRYGLSRRVVPRIIFCYYSSRNAGNCVPGYFYSCGAENGETAGGCVRVPAEQLKGISAAAGEYVSASSAQWSVNISEHIIE